MKTDRIMWQINEGDEPSMPLVTTKEMFRKAYDGGYAIGAFNVNNMEIVQGITEAAREVCAPMILQVPMPTVPPQTGSQSVLPE